MGFDVSHVFLSRVPALISASFSASFNLFLAIHAFGKLQFYSSGPCFVVVVVVVVALYCSFCTIFLWSNDMLHKVQHTERTGSVMTMKSE
jgi:ABC-type multidrug transport system permease subunit